jgi:uncharacterized membrane protein YoaK (UPF0700 family)
MPPYILGVYAISSICGMLDAMSFLLFGHVFVEIMTGNLVFLAFSVGTLGTHTPRGYFRSIAPYLIAIGAFAFGALCGGRLVRAPGVIRERKLGFVVVWVTLLVALVMVFASDPVAVRSSREVVLAVLSIGMGVQNAMLRKWGVPDLATNVMTLTMTALVADSSLGGGENTRAVRRASSIGIFAVSACFGAFLTRYGVVWPIFIATVVFTMALPVLVQRTS